MSLQGRTVNGAPCLLCAIQRSDSLTWWIVRLLLTASGWFVYCANVSDWTWWVLTCSSVSTSPLCRLNLSTDHTQSCRSAALHHSLLLIHRGSDSSLSGTRSLGGWRRGFVIVSSSYSLTFCPLQQVCTLTNRPFKTSDQVGPWLC